MRSSIGPQSDGAHLIAQWLRRLHAGGDAPLLWRSLDADLRLATAQRFLLHLGIREPDDTRAAALAETASADPDLAAMVTAQCRHWQKKLAALARGAAVAEAARPVGADMELHLVLPAVPPRAEDAGAGRTFPFITRRTAHGPVIAAVGAALPLPGWPPTVWVPPPLRGDAG